MAEPSPRSIAAGLLITGIVVVGSAAWWSWLDGSAHRAVLRDDVAALKAQRIEPADAAHELFFARSPEVTALLTAGGADLNAVNVSGRTALAFAVHDREIALVDVLCKAGADSNLCGRDGITPLHAATLRDRTEMAAVLLAYGANPGAIDWSGRVAWPSSAPTTAIEDP